MRRKVYTRKSRNSLWRSGTGQFVENRIALIACGFIVCLSIICAAAPLIAPYSYFAQDLSMGARGPSWTHLFGTDSLGRDLFTRVLYGGRISLMVGIAATSVAMSIGIIWGSLAGWKGGVTDSVMMRIVDILYAFPFTIFVILLMVVFGRSMLLLFLSIGAVEWLTMARIVRAQVMSLKKKEFVEAAIGLGIPTPKILFKHIFPNMISPIIIYTTLTMPAVMLLEAFLSFLGLGVQPPASSLGILIREGAESMETYPWLLLFPGVVLSMILFALNFIGDGLRDAFDPRTQRE